MKHFKLTFLLLATIPSVYQYSAAQWIGSDEPPIEAPKAQVSYLGSDVTKSTTPGGPSAVVRVYGEGYHTPPAYVAKSEHISALKLNPGQEYALKKEFPDFVPWTLADYGTMVKYFPFSKRQMPYAISWDFNSKDEPITVITGHDATQNYLVIFKPEGKEYRIIKHEIGGISTPPYTTLPTLRMIKRGTMVRLYNEEHTPVYVVKHNAFTHINVRISTNAPPDQYTQLCETSTIFQFREGLFLVDRTNIRGLRTNVGKPAGSRPGGDIIPSLEITKALAKFNKDFKIWTNRDYSPNHISASPQYAIKHDFNGDGIEDMVVAGHDNDANLVLEVLSGTDGYHVNPVGDSISCYAKNRERMANLPFKPSHSLSLYSKETDYAGLAPRATKNLWKYRDAFLVGIRMLNTCKKRRTGPVADFEPDFEYGSWTPWVDKNKEALYVYGEAKDGICCPDNGFELLPPAKDK